MFHFFATTVTYSYCVDAENRHLSKNQQHPQQQNNMHNSSNNNPRREHQQHHNAPPPQINEQFTQPPPSNGTYQYALSDIPKLAEQAANMYATNPAEKQSYYEYYKDFYTKQLSQNVS